MFPSDVMLIEVGLRDGLQSESVIVPTETKLAWLERLLEAGLRQVQVCSFVSPSRVPQMADAEAFCARLPQRDGVRFSGLALNLKGVERAHVAGLHEVDLGVSASDTHSQKNMGKTTQQALVEFDEMARTAHRLGMGVRGAVQVAFGCVYEGDIPLVRVCDMVRHLRDAGAGIIALADSSGMANPAQMGRVLEAVLPLIGDVPLCLHLHDTRGVALANVTVALMYGVRLFDTSFGGLGGCPFIKGATGNVSTEDTAHMLAAMGIATGVDVAGVLSVSSEAQAWLGHGLSSKIYQLDKGQS